MKHSIKVLSIYANAEIAEAVSASLEIIGVFCKIINNGNRHKINTKRRKSM